MGRFDAIVVGAGPAGSIAARELARLGRRVVLLETKRFPRPKTCAGGISPWARSNLRRLGLWDRIAPETYEVRGIRLGAPSGRETQWIGAASAAVLIRSRFDHLLAQAAVEAGAELREDSSVVAIVTEHGHTVGVRLKNGVIIEAPWVVAANGAHGRLDSDPRPRRMLETCMAWFDDVAFTPHVVEMYFDAELAPHYGWLYPESDTRASIGICVDAKRLGGRSVRDVFGRFLKRHFAARLPGMGTESRWRGFPMSVTVDIRHHAPPGVLLAGEACRLVNPATGEGISYAIHSGSLAAKEVDTALRTGEEPAVTAARYERKLRLRSGLSLRAGDWFCRFGMPLVECSVRAGEISWLRRGFGQVSTC
ncbi:MAG: geranylgeranyl reductase family protein [Deltaproteobacteria bacterium]|nr:geranylgeranyl reductase family protein [Deltaproteobacteria bacterium]